MRAALDAADFALSILEHKLDDLIGRSLRLALGRYAAVVVLGVPIAWAVPGFHWQATSTFGLLAGVALFAVIDIARAFHKKTKRH